MEKSHVSMEQHQCIVCGTLYDTGAILLDKRMKALLEPHTVTGTGMCAQHAKLKDEGYVALIEADATTESVQPRRTGRIAHIRSSGWADLFTTPVPAKSVAYAEKDVMDMLEQVSKG